MEMATNWYMKLVQSPWYGPMAGITPVFTGSDATAIAEEKQRKMEKWY